MRTGIGRMVVVVVVCAVITLVAIYTLTKQKECLPKKRLQVVKLEKPSFQKPLLGVPPLGGENVGLAPVPGGHNDIVVSLDDIMRAPVTLQQDDIRLIKYIQEKYLYPPSVAAYNLKHPDNEDPSIGQSTQIRNILGDKVENGFFIECGALDGETRSNTLVFEKRLGWKGVLIEADPKNFGLVMEKNRKAHAVSACLSTEPYPNKVMFEQNFNIGKISNLQASQQQVRGYAEVQCLPLYSILLALNRTSVDYFSLDVEGMDLQVLQTIPWNKIDIKTLSVEFYHDDEGKGTLRKFMEEKGYTVYTEVTHPNNYANDFIFYRNDIIPKIPKA